MTSAAAHPLNYCALRYFNVAGADPDGEVGEHHRPETHLIPLILDAIDGKRDALTIHGTDYPTPDGTCIRDYVHVMDLVDAHVLGLNWLRTAGELRFAPDRILASHGAVHAERDPRWHHARLAPVCRAAPQILRATEQRVIDLAREELGSLIGRNITVLGASFKPNSDDVRDSPALAVAGQLSLAGASVRVYDPQGMDNARKVFPTLDYATSLEDALRGAELVILATEWQEFKEMDPRWAAELVDKQLLIDGRNVLNITDWQNAGWQLRALGRSL